MRIGGAGYAERSAGMKKRAAVCGIAFMISICLLCGCGQAGNVKIQLSTLQDVLSWDGGVVWSTEKGVFVKNKKRAVSSPEQIPSSETMSVSEALEKSIFQDPFYEKEEGEENLLQYIEDGCLYYIRIFNSRYYELCSMDLESFEETVLYANYSEAERKYDYLGLNDKTALFGDERRDVSGALVRKFCVIGDAIYMMDEEALYEMNRWTKYKKAVDDDVDLDTELVFIDSKIYYKNADELLMEYDRESGEKKCLSDWMVQKLCYGGGGVLVQRMNGDLYRCHADQEVEKLMALSGQLIQGEEKYFYCLEGSGGKLVVYDAETLQPADVIEGDNIWGVAEVSGGVVYYLEAEEESLVLRESELLGE